MISNLSIPFCLLPKTNPFNASLLHLKGILKTQKQSVHSHTPIFKIGGRALFLGRSCYCAEVLLNGWENFHVPCLYLSGGFGHLLWPAAACLCLSVGQYKNGVWQRANGYTAVTNMPLLRVKTLPVCICVYAHSLYIPCITTNISWRATFHVAFCQLIGMPTSSAKPSFGTAAVGSSYPGQHSCTAAFDLAKILK